MNIPVCPYIINIDKRALLRLALRSLQHAQEGDHRGIPHELAGHAGGLQGRELQGLAEGGAEVSLRRRH